MGFSYRAIVKAFSRIERIVFVACFVVLFLSGGFLFIHFLGSSTITAPDRGGIYHEGVVGQPSFINPILAKNGTPDKDLVTLIFANIPTIAQSIKHDDTFRTWNVRIKEDATWEDGSPITSDDIIFTVQTIQNQDTLSPLLSDWQNIVPARISEREVQFQLLNSYALFENLLAELRPIPKKFFADISPANLKLSSYNLEPIGSGPFAYNSLSKRRDGFIESFSLVRNSRFGALGQEPYIDEIEFYFFENEEKLVRAYNMGTIDGFGTQLLSTATDVQVHSLRQDVPTSKYFSAFFNASANDLLSSSNIREGLVRITNNQAIIERVFDNTAVVANGPLPPSLEAYNPAVEAYTSFNQEAARQLFEHAGWTKEEESGIWKQKGGENILFTIKTPDAWPLRDIALELGRQWKEFGIPTDVISLDPQIINEDTIRTRNYEILVFGNILSLHPDLFSFWHSSERFYPGLNLSLYENKTIDDIIKSLRTADVASNKRTSLLEEAQREIVSDYPALFIASPRYFYVTRSNIEGITISLISLPHNRFDTVTGWYLKTRRLFK